MPPLTPTQQVFDQIDREHAAQAQCLQRLFPHRSRIHAKQLEGHPLLNFRKFGPIMVEMPANARHVPAALGPSLRGSAYTAVDG
jgi:hypothetical protein